MGQVLRSDDFYKPPVTAKVSSCALASKTSQNTGERNMHAWIINREDRLSVHAVMLLVLEARESLSVMKAAADPDAIGKLSSLHSNQWRTNSFEAGVLQIKREAKDEMDMIDQREAQLQKQIQDLGPYIIYMQYIVQYMHNGLVIQVATPAKSIPQDLQAKLGERAAAVGDPQLEILFAHSHAACCVLFCVAFESHV